MSISQQVREMEETKAKLELQLEELKAIAEPHEKLLKNIREHAAAKKLSLRDIALDLCPELAKSGKAEAAKQSRRPRAEKTYTNPNLQGPEAVVITKGGNNKTLKAWKEEYGAETVESWAQVTG